MQEPTLLLRQWLTAAREQGASDLHLTAGMAPTARVNGVLVRVDERVLSPDECAEVIESILTPLQDGEFNRHGEVDFSYSVPGVSRFRISVFRQRGCPSLAARLVPDRVPSFNSLGLPAQIERFTERSQGLCLITGPTGSGKSTTLAALVDTINHRDAKHIITLEDPIEYLHKHDKSIIDQREVGLDTMSFQRGLRAALRQDPDVILVGEMRDLETIETAITAAETGHLVFATLHTPDAVQTIDRIVDVFPTERQSQIRVQLSGVLLGVVAQRLLPAADGKARVAACEILVNTPAVANLVRTEKLHQLQTVMQTGKSFGMQTMEMHLRDLASGGKIDESSVRQWAKDWHGTASSYA